METRKKKSFKRLFAFLMAFVMVTTLAVSAVFAADPTFKDVPKDYEFYDEIEDLAAKEIIGGFGTTGLFKPEEKLTRAQAAKMIAKAAGIKVSKGFKTSFTDVDEDVDMYEHIWALEEAEIVKGWGTTKEFRPDEAIERGHVAKMIARAFGVVEGNTKVEFKDLPADKDVADAIMALASNDIVKGYGTTGEFRPEEPVLRGQFAKMVSRAMGLEVLEVRATNSKTVRVKFNRTIKGLKAVDFTIYEKDKVAIKYAVEKVKTDDEFYFLTLFGELKEDITYILEVEGIEGKFEFEYVEGSPKTLKFLRTSYTLYDDFVEYAVLDEDGNDITVDHEGDLAWASSKTDVISDLGAIAGVGIAVVNLSLMDGSKVVLTTGNVNISVSSGDPVLTSIGTFKLDNDCDSDFTGVLRQEMFLSDSYVLCVEFLDQDGYQYDASGDNVTFRPATPLVATIVEDTGLITPIKTGDAKFIVTIESGKTKLNKTFTVPIKADPKATSLKVVTNDSDLVLGSSITKGYAVYVLDQYGKVFDTSDPLKATISKDGVADGWAKANEKTLNVTDGIHTGSFTPLGESADPATGVVTFKFGAIKADLTLKSVKPSTFKEYVAVPAATSLDTHSRQLLDPRYVGPTNAAINVYAIDVNGNYTRQIPFASSGIEYAWLELVDIAPLPAAVSITGQNVVNADAPGKQKVKVHVQGTAVDPILIDTIEFTVVNSEERLTTVKQTANSVESKSSAAGPLRDKLYSVKQGNIFTPAVFLGYDQYGDRIDIKASDVTNIWSSNPNVIKNGSAPDQISLGGQKGTANVTLRIAEKDFNIDIKIDY